ncbi:MAG: hypothetical protein WBA76_02865 [Phormidesmis sp.]
MHSPNRLRWFASAALCTFPYALVALASGCNQVSTNAFEATADFEATAATTYVWQVEYVPRGATPDRPNDRRLERFESTTVVNVNGIRPDAAGSGPDSQGLWWPVLPPEPTVDEIEARREKAETPRSPEVIKAIDYQITFDQADETKTLPTDYDVYRQAVKAFEKDRPLALTLGPQDESVLKAEIQ